MLNWAYNPNTVKHILELDDITQVDEQTLHQVLYWGITEILSEADIALIIKKLATAESHQNPLIEYVFGRLVRLHNQATVPSTALGIPKLEQQVEALLQRASPSAKTIAGSIYLTDYGVEKDAAKAFDLFQSAEGYVPAHFFLASCYYNGEGTRKNLKLAFQHFLPAAEQGLATAQRAVAICYLHGLGITRDRQLGLSWLNKAAEQKLPEAQLLLGNILLDENPTSSQGFVLLQEAAERGEREAQRELGHYYRSKQYGNQDSDKALYWFKQAAEQNDPEATFFALVYSRLEKTDLSKKANFDKWHNKLIKYPAPANSYYFAKIAELLACEEESVDERSKHINFALSCYQKAIIKEGGNKCFLDAFWQKQLTGETARSQFNQLKSNIKIPTKHLLDWLSLQVDWLCEAQDWRFIGFLLQHSTELQALTIHRGNLTQWQFEQALAEPLQENDTLERLVLRSDQLKESFIPVLEKLAASHPSLSYLEINSNQINPAHQDGLNRLLAYKQQQSLLTSYKKEKQSFQQCLPLALEDQNTELLLSLRERLILLAREGLYINLVAVPLYQILTKMAIYNDDSQLLEMLIGDFAKEFNQAQLKAILATLEQAVQQGASKQLLTVFWQTVIKQFDDKIPELFNGAVNVPIEPNLTWSVARQRWSEIANALAPNLKCQVLVLTQGDINEADLSNYILKPLETNDTLETLVIASDKLTITVMSTLEKLAATHPSLTTIEISGKPLPSECQLAINQLLSEKQTAKAHYKVAKQAYHQWKAAKEEDKNLDVLLLAEANISDAVQAQLAVAPLAEEIFGDLIEIAEQIFDIATLEAVLRDYLHITYQQPLLLKLLQAIGNNSMAQAERDKAFSVTAYAYLSALRLLTADNQLATETERNCDLILAEMTGIGLLADTNKLELAQQSADVQTKAREFLQAVLELLTHRNLSCLEQAKNAIANLLAALPLANPVQNNHSGASGENQRVLSYLFQPASPNTKQQEQETTEQLANQLKQ